MILEPLLQGAVGMRVCRASFIDKVVACLKKNNILVIFDEVATGFGRLGKMFAHEYCIQKPDILCLSKGLTGGYMPLSATLVNHKIYDAFLGNNYKNAFTHGHSFTANPLACSAAIAAIDMFEKHQTFDKIAYIQKTYQEIIPEFKYHKSITNIRTIGTMLAWDIVSQDAHYKARAAETIKDILLKSGYNMRPLGKTFYLLPPYCIHGLSVHLRKIFGFF
jgi:adenosylmethionine-8-amino-7-oxononanoate aminotransferase